MSDASKRLRKIFDVILQEVDRNPNLANELERLVEKTVVGEDGTATATSGRERRTGRRKPGALDPFVIFRDGEGALRRQLSALDEDQLKDIIAEHMMDASKLAMKWKVRERLVDLIVSSVDTRSRKGSAFLTTDLAVVVSKATYVSDWHAVLVPVEISNRGHADTITDISLKVEDEIFESAVPSAPHQVERIISGFPRRLDPNDILSGSLYFGPSLANDRRVPPRSKAELTIRRASGSLVRQLLHLQTDGEKHDHVIDIPQGTFGLDDVAPAISRMPRWEVRENGRVLGSFDVDAHGQVVQPKDVTLAVVARAFEKQYGRGVVARRAQNAKRSEAKES